MMVRGLIAAGHEVRLVRPPAILGCLRRGETGLAKWIGYIDRFLFYPILLRQQVQWADVVHICDQANAVYIPHLGDKPYLLTCHDAFAIRAALGEIAESSTSWTGRIYQDWILANLQNARAVACVSAQTREEVQRLTGLPDYRITVVPNALNYPYKPMEQGAALNRVKQLGVDPQIPFFVHVGGNDWYKNRLGVVHIFNSIVRRPLYHQYRLVMAGKPWPAAMRALVSDLNLVDQVHELVEVSDEDLRALYSSAQALLFASLQEGFGWPIVEAQACGCPVITSRRSSMIQVSGGEAIFIDPAEPETAATQIESSWDARSQLVKGGLINAGRFDLQTMINKYVAAYNTVRAEALSI
jgi:glycosyltransferase involved in cell wall biosynthesis